MNGPDDLDVKSLEKYLIENGVSIESELHASQIAGGRSNLTYRLSDDRQAWVLRRPPGSGVTPSAHDVGREFHIIQALQDSAVPVPRTVLNCEDPSVIGAPFTLVSFVTGEVLRTQAHLRALSTQTLEVIHDELIRVLALLHSLPYEPLGLRYFGRPNGFVTRQIRRWRQQWDQVATQEFVDIDPLYHALVESPPPQRQSAIVHGDFRVDNTLLNMESLRVAALIDWEMAALGDPLTDLATMCAYMHPSFDYVIGEPAASTSTCWPGVDATAQRYAELSGVDLDGFDRYRALAYFKLAVIAAGIAARYRSGVGSGPGFETADQAVPHLVAEGLAIMAAQ